MRPQRRATLRSLRLWIIRRSLLERGALVTFGEIVNVNLADGYARQGEILEFNMKKQAVQIFEGTSNTNNESCHIEYAGDTLKMPISGNFMDGSFNGSGNLLDKGLRVLEEEFLDISAASLNPKASANPKEIL